ncbi:MAG: mechanosensitive ion channel [Bacteroidales bacterium]|nr:mechanosensitive ion channel [Bacteroidales bacterium]MDD4657347.1 mechanosensitive ion channel [Bacteroidales bacterium]
MENGITARTTALFGIVDKIYELLLEWGASPALASFLDEIISVSLLLLIAYLANFFAKHIVYRVLVRFVKISSVKWDDVLVDHNVIKYLVRIIPGIILHIAAPIALRSTLAVDLFQRGAEIFIVVAILQAISSTTTALTVIFSDMKKYANKPIKVIFQVISVLAYFVGAIIILSVLINTSFTSLFAAMGASMAIVMLIFKDSILGFVAGWQLSINDMLRPGDWITMPKYGADGDVEEISLYSVKVRNFDKTITTIPPYALISESFQNWRGMQESDGRRVKRSVIIDMNSIKFCTPEMIERFKKIGFLKDYLDATTKEIEEYNKENNIDNSVLVNGRRQTNIGVFRAYLNEYLKRHPLVNDNIVCMVRQLQPTEKGIPVELYFFISDKNWVNYENIQSDIFDHVLAIVEQFDLRIFQYPTNALPITPLEQE